MKFHSSIFANCRITLYKLMDGVGSFANSVVLSIFDVTVALAICGSNGR
jgi:hypothetical protein